ncbi:MAG: carboxypeptidase M32 [Phycisphaeraceae bacterium]|nr:MAG: carboxypeptidase M32 [Phycisphaeraceae bacterium]
MPTSSYAELCSLKREAATLASVAHLLGWDQETYMPSGGTAGRAEMSAAMAGLIHERETSKRLGELIAACASDKAVQTDDAAAANVREMRRDYDRATKLPKDLVTELANVGARSQDAWKDARKKSDFKAFQPWLEKMVALTRKKAECYGVPAGGELYDALLDEYEPDARAAEIEAVFNPLRDRLSGLVAELLDNGTPPDTASRKVHVPEAAQHAFGLKVIEQMGFDLTRGRLDTTTHPFCEGLAPGDTRLTTRYDENYFMAALYGIMHEAGHGLYEQGLPKQDAAGEPSSIYGTPLSEARSLGIHESQSRGWENFVGRGRAFWDWAKPVADGFFGSAFAKFSPDQVYRASNLVERSFIRVEADEATYNLHVMLRFGIERAMISGDLAIKDVPGEWNERFERMLGVKVPDDAQGCLQDVHWSFGLIGYFPTYTLGNLYAAQFFEAIREEAPDLDARIAKGDMSPVLDWTRKHIHSLGRRFTAAEICERATGKPLGPDPLMRHLEGKLRPIYGV